MNGYLGDFGLVPPLLMGEVRDQAISINKCDILKHVIIICYRKSGITRSNPCRKFVCKWRSPPFLFKMYIVLCCRHINHFKCKALHCLDLYTRICLWLVTLVKVWFQRSYSQPFLLTYPEVDLSLWRPVFNFHFKCIWLSILRYSLSMRSNFSTNVVITCAGVLRCHGMDQQKLLQSQGCNC